MKLTAKIRSAIYVILFLFIALGSVHSAFAQGLESEMFHIQALGEAGDTDRALRRYESLLQDKLEKWQQAVIQYNMGTILLIQGKPDQALSQYRSISDVDNPLLKQRLDANTALAKLMLVEEEVEKLNEKEEPSTSDYSLAISALRNSLDAISTAENSACTLSYVEGSQICEQLPEIDEMRFEAKRLLAGLLDSYFKQSKIGIEELTRMVSSQADLKESIQHLLIFYELVLVQEPLQEESLAALAKTQRQLEPLLEAQETAPLKPLYKAAVRDLDIGRQAVESLQFLQGRMFVLVANTGIKMMAQKIGRKKEDPIAILEQAIQLESLVLQLNVLKQSSEGREPLLDSSNSLLQHAQQRVFPVVEKFFTTAIAQQVREFRAAAPSSGPDWRCQEFPWDVAIPLIVEGKRDAENAKAALASGILELNKAADSEALAIKKWQEALQNLKASKKTRKKEKQQDNKQQKEEKKQKNEEGAGPGKEKQPSASGVGGEEKNVPGRADLNSVLRLLQEMENDDRSKPKMAPKNEGQGKSSGNSSVQRPW